MKKSIVKFFVSTIFGLLMTFLVSSVSYSQTMNLAPYKVNLNASGIALTLDSNWSGIIPSGNQITGHNIQLYIDGVYIVDAIGLSYCWIDQMFKATFDRADIIANTYVQSLANTGAVLVTMSGTYSITTIQDIVIVEKWDWMEIEKPGKKK